MKRFLSELKKHKRWLTVFLFISIAGVISWVLYQQKEALVSFPWKFDWKALLFVSLFHSIALGATFWAWYVMMARLGKFTDLAKNFRYYYISTLTKRLPTSIPYIGTRLVMYKEENVQTAVIINCIFLENLLIGVAGIIAFLIFAPFYTHVPNNIIIPMFIAAVLLITLFLFKPEWIIQVSNWALRRFHREEITTSLSRGDMLYVIGIYLLPWLFAGMSFYFAPRALSNFQGLSLMDSFQISMLSTLVSLLYFVFPGGLALKELTASVLLMAWMPLSTALVITIALRVIQTIDEIIWALIALSIPMKRRSLVPKPG